MSALEANRDTPEMELIPGIAARCLPVAEGEKLYAGAFVCTNAQGRAVAGVTATGLIPAGRCEALADNSDGLDDAINVNAKPGVYRWANGDSITNSSRGAVCYLGDDQTVYSTDGGGTRSKAGVIVDVDDDGVWVATGFEVFSNPAATPSGTIQKRTVTVDYTDFTATADGVDESINVGAALPANAVLVAAKYTINTPFAGAGVATLTMIVGYSGDTNGVFEAVDIFGDSAANYGGTLGTAMGPALADSKQLVANFDPDSSAGLDELTAGNITIDVYYIVAF